MWVSGYLYAVFGMAIPVSVHAVGTNVQIDPRMSGISTYSTKLSISSDGVALISGFVRGKTGVTSTYVKGGTEILNIFV